jgi:hypothetical protein
MSSKVEGARKGIYCGLCFGLPEEISPDHLLADFEQAVRDEEWQLIERVLEEGMRWLESDIYGGWYVSPSRTTGSRTRHKTAREAVLATARELGVEVPDGQTQG